MWWSEAEIAKRQEKVRLRDVILPRLVGGLWHTTRLDRFQEIVATGAILPEPNVPDSERWNAAAGRKFYPYARFIGGVSLFDFEGLDRDAYAKRCPMSQWETFVPFRGEWKSAVWIEIDRSRLASHFISGTDLWQHYLSSPSKSHNIMPFIEADHLGPLPCKVFAWSFVVSEGDPDWRLLEQTQ
jgi:hypothetical protein